MRCYLNEVKTFLDIAFDELLDDEYILLQYAPNGDKAFTGRFAGKKEQIIDFVSQHQDYAYSVYLSTRKVSNLEKFNEKPNMSLTQPYRLHFIAIDLDLRKTWPQENFPEFELFEKSVLNSLVEYLGKMGFKLNLLGYTSECEGKRNWLGVISIIPKPWNYDPLSILIGWNDLVYVDRGITSLKAVRLLGTRNGDSESRLLKFRKAQRQNIPLARRNPNKNISYSDFPIKGIVEDVLRKYGHRAQRVRKGYMIRCPFHEDKNPSMLVFEDGRGAYCFGCNKYYPISRDGEFIVREDQYGAKSRL
jgi:hypothetical protein